MSQNTATKPTILLVDSSKFFLTIEKQFLNKLPLNILEANSAAATIALCRSSKPDLIYLAHDLADQAGADCCRQLKADPDLHAVPVILICNNDEDQADLTRRSNCDAILLKPLDRTRFLEIGRSFLAGFREPRRACLNSVRLRKGEQSMAAKALDISSGGIFIKTGEVLRIGTTLDLEVQLTKGGETGPRIACNGRVCWINAPEKPVKPHHPPGYGIQFLELPTPSLAVLNGYLRTLDLHT